MSKLNKVRKFIELTRVVQVFDICDNFNIKEPMARRYLKNLNTCASVNHGAGYYVLKEQNTFDRMGLLYIGDTVFYIKGKLIDALVGLVKDSDEGLTPPELSKLLKTSVHSQLPKLVTAGVLSRSKVSGVRGFVYLNTDSKKRKQQLKKRRSSLAKDKKVTSSGKDFNVEEALDILVTLIKKPNLTAKGIALSLQRRGKKISSDKVKMVVGYFDISKKNF
jgi:predicted transcriptional regulator